MKKIVNRAIDTYTQVIIEAPRSRNWLRKRLKEAGESSPRYWKFSSRPYKPEEWKW